MTANGRFARAGEIEQARVIDARSLKFGVNREAEHDRIVLRETSLDTPLRLVYAIIACNKILGCRAVNLGGRLNGELAHVVGPEAFRRYALCVNYGHPVTYLGSGVLVGRAFEVSLVKVDIEPRGPDDGLLVPREIEFNRSSDGVRSTGA